MLKKKNSLVSHFLVGNIKIRTVIILMYICLINTILKSSSFNKMLCLHDMKIMSSIFVVNNIKLLKNCENIMFEF